MVHGNIYPAEKVPDALTHFFRTENLVALRELALGSVADETEEELLAYLGDRHPDSLWETRERIMVAATELFGDRRRDPASGTHRPEDQGRSPRRGLSWAPNRHAVALGTSLTPCTSWPMTSGPNGSCSMATSPPCPASTTPASTR